MLVSKNEKLAIKDGLNAIITHPFDKKPIKLREFLKWVLKRIEPLAKEIGYFEYLNPIYELSKGEKNEAERKIDFIKKNLGKNIKLIKDKFIEVPDELVRQLLLERKKYLFNDLLSQYELDINLKI